MMAGSALCLIRFMRVCTSPNNAERSETPIGIGAITTEKWLPRSGGSAASIGFSDTGMSQFNSSSCVSPFSAR